jgi:hypothetical protein
LRDDELCFRSDDAQWMHSRIACLNSAYLYTPTS